MKVRFERGKGQQSFNPQAAPSLRDATRDQYSIERTQSKTDAILSFESTDDPHTKAMWDHIRFLQFVAAGSIATGRASLESRQGLSEVIGHWLDAYRQHIDEPDHELRRFLDDQIEILSREWADVAGFGAEDFAPKTTMPIVPVMTQTGATTYAPAPETTPMPPAPAPATTDNRKPPEK